MEELASRRCCCSWPKYLSINILQNQKVSSSCSFLQVLILFFDSRSRSRSNGWKWRFSWTLRGRIVVRLLNLLTYLKWDLLWSSHIVVVVSLVRNVLTLRASNFCVQNVETKIEGASCWFTYFEFVLLMAAAEAAPAAIFVETESCSSTDCLWRHFNPFIDFFCHPSPFSVWTTPWYFWWMYAD